MAMRWKKNKFTFWEAIIIRLGIVRVFKSIVFYSNVAYIGDKKRKEGEGKKKKIIHAKSREILNGSIF